MDKTEPIIQIKNLSYSPITVENDILKDINLDVNHGDFILLLGPPGCGKSTLTRCFNGIIPHIEEGKLKGSIKVSGKDTRTSNMFEFAPIIGMVFQNPDDQIVSLKVLDEVAWGVENLGLEHEEINRRVYEFMDLLAITHLKDRLTFAISGGQKQKVSIASNLAMLQEVLVLDDPTTDLDPICKIEVVQALERLHRDMQKTLVVIEHDLTDLIELANRFVIMDGGQIVYDGNPGKLISDHYDELVKLGINLPQHIDIAHKVIQLSGNNQPCPTHKEQAFQVLKSYIEKYPAVSNPQKEATKISGDPVISVRDLNFSYLKNTPVIRGINFDILNGEFVAIVGANGSGKSTLVNTFTGLLVPDSGKILINGHDTKTTKINELAFDIGYVFQNPDHQLFNNTVEEEVAFSLKLRLLPEDQIEKRVKEVLEFVQLDKLRQRHPFSLSRGQRQKLAVATALVHQPKVILLDEPTTGQDRHSLAGLLKLMLQLNQQGNTTIMITHDMDIVAAYANRVMVMVNGQIVMDGHPIDIFYNNYDTLYDLNLRPPAVIDFCRRLQEKGVPKCLTVEQLYEYLSEVKLQKRSNI